MDSSLIQRLVEAGTPADLIADIAVELAKADANQQAIETRRTKDRERQRKYRDDKLDSVMSRDIADVTTDEDEQKEKIPQTPLKEKLPPSPKGDTPKRKTAHRLPDDFAMPASWLAWARSEKGWSEKAVGEESANFTDYWQACGGAKARKTDWRKTWQVWVRQSNRNGGPAPPANDLEAMRRKYGR